MVKKLKNLFLCEECEMIYWKKALAEKCEAWCEKYKSCNMEIVKHAVQMKRGKSKK